MGGEIGHSLSRCARLRGDLAFVKLSGLFDPELQT